MSSSRYKFDPCSCNFANKYFFFMGQAGQKMQAKAQGAIDATKDKIGTNK